MPAQVVRHEEATTPSNMDMPSDSDSDDDAMSDAAVLANAAYFEALLAQEPLSLEKRAEYEERALAPLFDDRRSNKGNLQHFEGVTTKARAHSLSTFATLNTSSKSSLPAPRRRRSRRRCRLCGCAMCQQCQKMRKPCDASQECRSVWVEANGGRIPRQPSEAPAKNLPCVRCAVRCWIVDQPTKRSSSVDPDDVKKAKIYQKTPKSMESQIKTKPRRRLRNRGRCKLCGCALCTTSNGGRIAVNSSSKPAACSATEDVKRRWVEAHGGWPPRRPSTSHLRTCLRCHRACWDRSENEKDST